ncbi:MAG: hypothetical protein COW18_05405 [Zetaproteobacteria bacterium CG12_big_fil_rev_8_21_14_0_65_54_13]|nr:MAG: hypothetical protein COX55_05500 [Zetaproteobacteria bacterium CG23_combo_of_CG06-09_8_20_14_all_54_7]PIW49461.1 MAG: hypothetical protein COW18_05405 [Zetaproteobacteria bacterium CG12_big_fil_rev_8_21_14_0_65_54_13]PIX54335.1 MAG: hypothetical protein COZ50_08475 [Zetaproteobacteria bacterium CG_4_10_14_3_um_filter_54_28]PJA28539.1 MAG: hypothetical protein CO188_09130 [Zetaproteobacteria bacterium CG_4_9_14_3_um_filter_54_145]
MKRILATAAIMLGLLMMSTPVMAGSNPCNPCSMQEQVNPCNPCAMKKQMNPCNPCSIKTKPANPCSMQKPANPCNPCSMKQVKGQWGTPGNTPIREHAFDNFRQAAELGKQMWNDENLGTSGMACLSCHSDHDLLNLDRNQNFPHYVKMVGDVVSLDQMINYCMLNPMKGKPFAKDSKELTAMAAYYRAYRMQYIHEQR